MGKDKQMKAAHLYNTGLYSKTDYIIDRALMAVIVILLLVYPFMVWVV